MIELRKLDPETMPAVASLFNDHRRVDLTLDSILAGQYGGNISITLDRKTEPQTVAIRQGSFIMLGGDAGSDTARFLLENLPPACYIMPAPAEWISRARQIHGDRLLKANRYTCSGAHLDLRYLVRLAVSCLQLPRPERIDRPAAELIREDELHHYHFGNWDSIDHFLATGFGYCIREEGRVLTACTSSLVSSRGVEVSITTRPDGRRRGAAAVTAARFLIDCLETGRYPNWDAGNINSVRLAEKLGYQCTGSYDVYYLDRA